MNCEFAKEMVRIRLFEKSCHYLKKLQFSRIVFKNMFYWYCEILLFSGIFGLELVFWGIS